MFRFLLAVTLGCVSHFTTNFKIRFVISSAKGFVSLYLGIFKFFTMFEKNEFSSSATFISWVQILSSTNAIFLFNLSLSEIRGLTVFQNFLLSATFLSFKFA